MTTLKQPTEITFPFEFKYKLSEAGQRNYLLAGGDGREEQSVSGRITLADAETLGYKFGNGRLSAIAHELRTGEREKWTSCFAWAKFEQGLSFEQALAEALKFHVAQQVWHEEVRQAVLEKEAAKQAAKQAALAGNAQFHESFYRRNEVTVEHNGQKFEFEGDKELSALLAARKAENERKAAEERAVKETEEAAREQGKQTQIAAWVAEFGTDDQKERLEAGLFPRDEAVQAMKDQAFAPASTWKQYQRITRAEISHAENCRAEWDEEWELNCETTNAENVTKEEWAALKEAKTLFPDAIECVIKRHHCHCSECEASEDRSGIYVKLQVGAFTFNREFAID